MMATSSHPPHDTGVVEITHQVRITNVQILTDELHTTTALSIDIDGHHLSPSDNDDGTRR